MTDRVLDNTVKNDNDGSPQSEGVIVKGGGAIRSPFGDTGSIDFINDAFGEDSELTARLERAMEGIVGQDHAIQELKAALFGYLRRPNADGPVALITLMGPPAVGKSECMKRVFDALGIHSRIINMSNLSAREIALLDAFGINESYKSAKPGFSTEEVLTHPVGGHGLDEFDRAHPEVVNMFLQIFDRGEAMDSMYQKNASYRDQIIILTTNAGAELYESRPNKIIFSDVSKSEMIESLRRAKKPSGEPALPDAIISRIAKGTMIAFNRLTPEAKVRITENELKRQIDYFCNIYGIDIRCDLRRTAELLMLSLGRSADARSLKSQAEMLIRSSVFNVVDKIKKESGNGKFFAVLNIDPTITDATEEAQRMLCGSTAPRVLVCCERGERRRLSKAIPEGIEVIFDDGEITPKKARFLDVSAAIVSVGRRSSRNEELFDTLVKRGNLPIYVYNTEQVAYPSFQRYVKLGAADCYSPVLKKESLSEWISDVCDGMNVNCLARSMMRRNRVVAYDLEYSYDIKAHSARVGFISVRIESDVVPSVNDTVAPSFEIPRETFDDIVGGEEIKKLCREKIEAMRDPMAHVRSGKTLPTGIIFYGPPGVGKTMTARAIANAAELPFFCKSASEFLRKYVGEGSRQLKALFDAAMAVAPSIIFLDEVDSIAMDRQGDSYSAKYSADVLNTLLAMMNNCSTPEAPVFVIAATNFSAEREGGSKLDPAFLRRFDHRIEMTLPDPSTRLALFRKATAAIEGVSVGDDTLINLSKRSVGWSHADIQKVINTANNRRPNGEIILDKYLIDEFESYGNGAVHALSDEDARVTAYHEAGHAIVALSLGSPVQFVTISGRGRYLGYAFSAEEDKKLGRRSDLCNFICRAMGGRAAELRLLGEDGVTAGASGDIEAAVRVATDMICRYGMAGLSYTVMTSKGEMTEAAREKVYELLDEQMTKSREIIDAEWDRLSALAQALIERQSLSEEEIKAVLAACA